MTRTSTHHHEAYRQEAGFTLVELLMAMVAAALLLVALGSVTGGLSNAIERQQATAAQAHNRPAMLMTQMVQNAQPIRGSVVVTTPDQLRFPILPLNAAHGAAQLEAALTITPLTRGSMLTVQLYDAATTLPIPGSRVESRYGAGRMRFDAETLSDANSEMRLVSATLHSPTRDGRTISITATPRITAAAGCVFDPISLSCRP